MSKWLKAARSARASKLDSGPFYAHDNSDNSDNSPPKRPIGTIGTIVTGGEGLLRRAQLAVVPNLADAEDIQVWLHERAGIREDSDAVRIDADKAAFDELLQIWCAANPIDQTPGQCAACGTAFEPPIMALPDGATVCDRPDHQCLITYGNGRRMAAVDALASIEIARPAWWEL